jgi:hypothetical protein
MKFKVYEEEKKDDTVYLKLTEEDDWIYLIAVDENGFLKDSGYILFFRNGTLNLCKDINPGLGISLDDRGRIEVIKT